MKICRRIEEIREVADGFRSTGSLALVPTMGALHAGHVALVSQAVENHPNTIATIFVNPTQFGNAKDLEHYPRTEEADLEILSAAGVAAVFLPDASEIYPEGDETIVETTNLATRFHGAVRPGHFRGVATVVSKLFNIVQPNTAYFGMKDYQQVAVIRRMVLDLHVPIKIVGVETVRDEDGVALSSRNARLTPEDRMAAPILNRALLEAETALKSGETIEHAVATVQNIIASEPRASLKAIDVVDAATFLPATGVPTKPIGFMISALFGDVLLIDQKEFTP